MAPPRKHPDDLKTSPARRGSIERNRERYRRAGLVQVNVWIPAADRDAVIDHCEVLRHAHLRKIGYGTTDADGNVRETANGPLWHGRDRIP